MIYYSDDKIIIRNMEPSDIETIVKEEILQGWDASFEKYEKRLKDQSSGKCISLVAIYLDNIAGYINVYPDSPWGAFGKMGYPEIVDFGVLAKYRNHGIGTKLMDIAEMIASKYSSIVYLGVGLHHGYGSAQRMYVKRGYIPDGSGVWYQDKVLKAYDSCVNDDDLVLYLSKNLNKSV